MSNLKKDVVLFFIAKVVIGFVGLLLVSLYSSNLTTSAYGEYSLVSGLISALISIFIGWIGSSALRYYIDYENNKNKFYNNILAYTFIMIFIIFIILFFISFISSTIPIKKYFIPIFFYTVSYSMIEVFEKIFRASQKTLIYTIGMIIQSILSIFIFYMLAKFLNLETISIFYSNAVSRFVFLFIAFISLSVFSNMCKFEFDFNLLKKFIKYGIPMIGVWGVSWVLSYCDRYIIALYYDTAQVGIYDMSYKLAENTINIIISSFTLAVFPTLIRIWKNKGKKAVELEVKNVLKYYFMLTIPAIIGMILISKNLYYGLIDSKYISGQSIVIIVSIGMFFNGLNSIFNKIWQLNEKTKYILYIMIISVIANIILNILFIPHFGIAVASVTTLISYLISTSITYFFVKKEFKIIIDIKSLLKTLLSTTAMGVFIIIFNMLVNNIFMLIIEVVISCIIYGIFLLLTKNIKLSDLKVKK